MKTFKKSGINYLTLIFIVKGGDYMANHNTDPKTGKFMKSELTIPMQEVIYKLVYGGYKTNREIYEELNIPESTFYGWFKMDIFTEALQKERDSKFKELSNKALKRLEDILVNGGNREAIQAIGMVLGENNHLKGKQEITLNTQNEYIVTILDGEEEK